MLTRRDFLKTTALGTLGVAAAAALAGCASDDTAGTTTNTTTGTTADVNAGAAGTDGSNNMAENAGELLDKDAATAAQSYQKDIMRIQNSSIKTIDPTPIKNASTGMYYSVYEMLFQNDNNMGGVMYPVLADKSKGSAGVGGYDHEEGSSDYTVYLYENIYDSAGNHITAEDVKFSFTKTYESGNTSGWDAAPVENIECVNDYTLTWHCTRELNKLGELENIWCRSFIFSQKAYEASPSVFATDACGTGHYVLDEFVVDSKAVLVKNEEHWQTPENLEMIQGGNVDVIEYVQVSESAQIVIALQNGALDYTDSLSADFLGDFMEGGAYADQFKIYSYLSNMCCTLQPNCDESAITSDIDLRLAIFYAIDTVGVCKMLGEKSYSPVPFVATSYFSDYDAEWETYENYNTVTDLALSKEHLDKSSYDGRELRLVCNTNQSTLAEIVMNMLGEAGIKIAIQAVDRTTSKAILDDPTQWELNFNITAGDFMVTLWSHNIDFSNTSTGDHSYNFVYDAEWQAKLEHCSTKEGHTKENMDDYVKYTIENAYSMGIYAQYKYCLYPSDITHLCLNDKLYVVPGGCVFEDPNA